MSRNEIKLENHPLLRKQEQEAIMIASTTTDPETLYVLSHHMYVNVRSTVAKNSFTPVDILNKLAYDPTQNVSYRASSNPNCRIKREFSSLSKCVICTISEIDFKEQCKNCN